MANPLRKVGEGTLGGFAAEEVTPEDAAKMELLQLGESGYRAFVVEDLDWATFAPWVVAKSDDTIWLLEDGMPARGFKPDTHAIVVDRHNTWRYLTSASASDRRDAPRDLAELEHRARAKAEHAERAAAERERKLNALRRAAVPVSLGTIDRSLRMTLAEAGATIDRHGGKIELRGGRVIVSLPPGAATYGTEPLNAATVIYRAEPAVVALLKANKPLPDSAITPSGALLE
jgi:hypothetical protein